MPNNPNAPKSQSNPNSPQSQTGQHNQGKSSVGSTVKEAANYVSESAKSAASNLGNTASEAASYVGHKADDATAAVGSGVKSFAHTVRDYGPGRGNMLGGATESVAEGMESAGRYLEEQGLSGIAEDVTEVVRRNPIPALFIAAGIGFLLARATTRS
jgi:hypothetical protein